MTRPSFCTHCGTAVPTDASMPRLGPWWLCGACQAAAATVPCAEYAHDYAGAVDDQGSAVWACRTCGAVLGHQAISTDVMLVSREDGSIG